MKWIVKSGGWYLDDVGWFKPQRMAKRYGTRKAAQEAASQILYEGFDARVVKLVPKTEDWVVRYVDEPGSYVIDPYVDEFREPNFQNIGAAENATPFEAGAADLFVAAWNAIMLREGFNNSDLEAVPCSML
jgi:hypothetical protein